MAPRSKSLPLDGPAPTITPPHLSVINGNQSGDDDDTAVTFEDGAIKIENPDGSVTINFNGSLLKEQNGNEFDRNIALDMSDDELADIASSLLEGIKQDEDSRKEWLETRALGITLLGLKLEKPRADAGSASAPLEGMSTVRHPLLLGSTVAFQATARAELLPATGPIKVRNDATMPPQNVLQDTSASRQLADSLTSKNELAEALEKDLNHYLTAIATEYIPDTDRMLFYVGFGGDGFKKVYNCPLRRRPVSESVDAEDLIISNAATDLYNAGRVTHRIKMRQSTLRRMQLLGVYRDVELNPPPPPRPNVVETKKQELSGIRPTNQRPEDRDFEVYECYCELDIDDFAPKQFKGEGLPLPYRVTVEKESRQILDIRRNWVEDDEQCLARRFFVQFPFIRGLGFYGLGYIHLLGNTTNALTAAWREFLDAGMYANFPGFIYAKGAGRQLTNQFRVPPGGGVGIDIGAQQSLKDAIMPLPYREPGAGFVSFVTHVEEVGRQLGSTAEIQVGEGKQDAPVGTTMALLEQATKVIDSAHKRLHAAQTEEFKLLKERFREDPEAFWRHNKKPTIQWKKEQFIDALNTCELVPVADPNNPTSLHRIAKATAIKQLQKDSPMLYDPVAVDMRVMRIAGIDPEGLFRPTPAPPPPDPRMEAINAKSQGQQMQNQIQLLETKIKAATQAATLQDKAQERASRERIEQWKIQLQELKIQEEKIIHAQDAQREAARAAQDMALKGQAQQQELGMKAAEKRQELAHETASKLQELHHDAASQMVEQHTDRQRTEHETQMMRDKHNAEMQRAKEKHDMDMQHAREKHAAELEVIRAKARATPKKAKGSS